MKFLWVVAPILWALAGNVYSMVTFSNLSPASDEQGFFCAYIGGDVERRVAVGGN